MRPRVWLKNRPEGNRSISACNQRGQIFTQENFGNILQIFLPIVVTLDILLMSEGKRERERKEKKTDTTM
jgi:hypothetical protein